MRHFRGRPSELYTALIAGGPAAVPVTVRLDQETGGRGFKACAHPLTGGEQQADCLGGCSGCGETGSAKSISSPGL